jgi:sugar phosphate isomerase/epimerase
MIYSRREFGKLALASLSAAALMEKTISGQAKPNSMINGVQLGTITYSYRSMPDQSAQALLKYVVTDGISAVELMGQPAEQFAGAPSGGGRDAGGGRGREQQLTPEQQAAQQAAQREAREAMREWRLGVSMDRYKELRKLYNDAGVKIYGLKISPSADMTDQEMDYVFNAGEAVGATHVTLELSTDVAFLKRVGAFAEKHKVFAAYHSHGQGSMTAFDQAFAASKANMANVDFGHYVAAGNVGGSPLQFLEKFHDRIASFHLKDRTTPEHGAQNLPWGTGETPIKEILQTVKKNKWKMPASIELEYQVPADSDAVKEVAKCLQYCEDALACRGKE